MWAHSKQEYLLASALQTGSVVKNTSIVIVITLLMTGFTFGKGINPSERGARARKGNWHRDPHISHGVILPRGTTLRKAEFYFADHEIMWLQFGYGVIDRVQVGWK